MSYLVCLANTLQTMDLNSSVLETGGVGTGVLAILHFTQLVRAQILAFLVVFLWLRFHANSNFCKLPII